MFFQENNFENVICNMLVIFLGLNKLIPTSMIYSKSAFL